MNATQLGRGPGSWLYRDFNHPKGSASAIAGRLGTEFYHHSVAYSMAMDLGNSDVHESIKNMRKLGVPLAHLFYGVPLWLRRHRHNLIHMFRAFSNSTIGVLTEIDATTAEYEEQVADEHAETKKVLVDLKLMAADGRDGDFVREVGNVNAATFIIVCVFAALARERELREKGESGTPLTPEEKEEIRVDRSVLFRAFCFWGEFIMHAVEQRIIRFEYADKGTEKPLFIDQKLLTELRLRMHFRLFKFKEDFKAMCEGSKKHGKTFTMLHFTPPLGTPSDIKSALEAEEAAEAETEKFGADEEE